MKLMIRFASLPLVWVTLPALVFCQEPPPAPSAQQGAPPARRFNRGAGLTFGTVRSVGVNQLLIVKPDGSTVTVQVNSQTTFREHGNAIELEDLKPGDHVVVSVRTPAGGEAGAGGATGSSESPSTGKTDAATDTNAGAGGSGSPSTITAAVVQRVPATAAAMFQGDRAFGRITAINGNQLIVQGRQGEKVIVVSKDTQFRKDGEPAALQDFKVGDPILASGKETNGQLAADFVATREMRPGAGFGGQGRNGPGESGQKPGATPPQNP